MYNFTNTDSKGNIGLPREAINIDGFFLDREINSFQTLSVQGRESLSIEMDSYSIPQRSGIGVRNRKLKERRLIVKFHINAKDTVEYYDALKKLKRHLYKEDILRIHFNDEPNIYYEGYLSTINDFDTNYFKSSGSFEVICPKPFKFHVNTKQTVLNGGKLNLETLTPVRLRSVETSALTSGDMYLTVRIGSYVMSFTDLPSLVNKKLKIDFEKLEIYLGTQNITSNLDFSTNFGNIRVSDEDKITITGTPAEIVVDAEVYDL